MPKVTKIGPCRICGNVGQLSFEHVPPASAFNDRSMRMPDAKRVFGMTNLDDLEKLAGKQSQRGQGDYTLCINCNSRTGHWYGTSYAAWAYQGATYLVRSPTQLTLSYPFHILPLRVIKQILCMFFSVNPAEFRNAHPDLVRFALNPKEKYLSPRLRLFAAYTASDRARSLGVCGALSANPIGGTTTRVYCEISYPPFSYILALNQQPPAHPMLDISFFSRFGYEEFQTLNLRMPVVSVYTPFPGDFRTQEEAIADRTEMRLLPAGSNPPLVSEACCSIEAS